MTESFLEKVIRERRVFVEREKASVDIDRLQERAARSRRSCPRARLESALSDDSRINIIAEIKRASPSKGIINDGIDVREIAAKYQAGGAAAISVLTEPDHFSGSIGDLALARDAVSIPLLRKDFIFDRYQIYESAASGADAVLLIVAALDSDTLAGLLSVATDLGMDVLVEVHKPVELERATAAGARIIGINSRNLNTLEVDLDIARDLILHRPHDALMVAESGLSSRNDILELKSLGYNGFLIGEALMRSEDPQRALEGWI
jgi:indole-3-glycerol phosphate synthase